MCGKGLEAFSMKWSACSGQRFSKVLARTCSNKVKNSHNVGLGCIVDVVDGELKNAAWTSSILQPSWDLALSKKVKNLQCFGAYTTNGKTKRNEMSSKRCAILWQFQVKTISVTSMSSEAARGDEHHVTFSQKFQDIKATLTMWKHWGLLDTLNYGCLKITKLIHYPKFVGKILNQHQ